MRTLAPPISRAAMPQTTVPVFARDTSWTLPDVDATAQTALERITPRTQRMAPTVSMAPTMFESSLRPGRPEVLGDMDTAGKEEDRFIARGFLSGGLFAELGVQCGTDVLAGSLG